MKRASPFRSLIAICSTKNHPSIGWSPILRSPQFYSPKYPKIVVNNQLRAFTGASNPRVETFHSPTNLLNSESPFFSNVANQASQTSSYRPFYLDNQATTPVDPRVIDKMLPLFTDMYGNPHSRSHEFGWEAEDIVEEARKQVADLIGAQPKNIIFTSGATESNNLSIKGVAEFYWKATKGHKNHIITTQTEHKCVLQSGRHLELNGWDVTYLGVDEDGLINLEDLKNAIRPGKTLLCSVMFVNNEIGVIQDLKSIGQICRDNKVFFHTDAAQGVGKIPINVDEFNIDLMSISGHKIYGPKGVGALYVRSKPRVRLSPIIDGGGQERGLRSGTLPAPLIAGFGEACRICSQEMEADEEHVTYLYNMLKNGIEENVPFIKVNGSLSQRYYGNLNVSFSFIEGESMIMALKKFAVSSGSACTSASLEPSYVLRAIGVDEALAHTSLRFGIGRFTTENEVKECIQGVVKESQRLRDMSPLYEIALEEERSGIKQDMVWT